MSRGYGKSYRKGFSHANIQFDKSFKENSNRPSAARSAGTVGKWGITSFTSIRSSNGLSGSQYSEVASKRPKLDEAIKQNVNKDPFSFEQGLLDKKSATVSPPVAANKPKKFFKSRDTTPKGDSGDSKLCGSDNTDFSPTAGKKAKANYGSKKFFQSKRSPTPPPSKRDESKPPIVLRICRGKSRLLSDSDESESTPTPSSTPSSVPCSSTSPHSTRDAGGSQPTRITRSTRRSMQQDVSSSPPAAAEIPTDTFTSLLSPEYIPPDKFELERKAIYDNLLGPSSPVDCSTGSTEEEQPEKEIEEHEIEHMESEPVSQEMEEISSQEEVITNTQQSETVSEMTDSSGVYTQDTFTLLQQSENSQELCSEGTRELNEFTEPEKLDEADEVLKSTNIELSVTNLTTEPKKPSDELVAESSSSESDSESSQLNPVVDDVDPAAENIIDAHREEILEKILEKPIEAPPVKLVISKKKGSIFKSRSMADGSKKRHALYKHKWCDDKDGQKGEGEGPNDNAVNKKDQPADTSPFDEFGFESAPLTRITRSVTNEYDLDGDADVVTSVQCTKTDKNYYTVVRNVKKAHQIQEIGEFQEFNDDVEYILDALQDNNPTGTRCLSAITLATKCMAPAFRMHVRAHGIVAKFFRALHDATKDQSLGLCTATVMFVLSQDRLNMDLDRDCLELMLNLLESDVSYQKALDECGLSSAQLHKNKMKVRELCAEIQSQGHAMHLNLDNITVGQLAMETLLSLTSKRAGEWFKEELRELGGLQHIMETICECCRQVSDYVVVWTDKLLDKLRKVDRCMRVLENVTHNNEQNQTYLLQYNNGIILDTLVKLYRLCDSEIPLYPVTDILDKETTGSVIREALLVTLKVLINLTHHFSKKSMGSALIGAKPGIVDASLHLLLQIPNYIPEQKKFELGVLVLMLLINLIQDNENNQRLLISAKAPADFESIFPCDKSALEALITQFYHCQDLARMAEKRTDAILDGEKDHSEKSQPKSHEEFIEETVAKLLQKAGTHMEYTFLASYVVMLIGFLIMGNAKHEANVRQFLKDHTFKDMVEILQKFFSFMNLTASTEASNVGQIKATEVVIKYMEDCDKNCENTETTTKNHNLIMS